MTIVSSILTLPTINKMIRNKDTENFSLKMVSDGEIEVTYKGLRLFRFIHLQPDNDKDGYMDQITIIDPDEYSYDFEV